MRFRFRTPFILANVLVLLGLAAVSQANTSLADFRVTSPHPQVVADFELEIPRGHRPFARTDSNIEDEATRPIRRILKVDRGDTLMDLLVQAGIDRSEAHNAIQALRKLYDPRTLKAGHEIIVTFGRSGDGIAAGGFQGVGLQPQPDRQLWVRRHDDGFAASEVKLKVTRELARYSGTIRSSLFEAAAQAGVPVQVLVGMIRALSYDVDFQRDIQPGDGFEVMFERFYDTRGEVVRDGEVLYANLIMSGTPIAIYRHAGPDGEPDYYNRKGESVRKALLRTPVDGARLSSGFGKRKHPILGYNKMHKGVDFAAPTGTPIYAAGTGTIEMAGKNGGYGYYVRIRHSSGYSTAYAHLSRFAKGIRSGKKVRQGEIIGYVGTTGRSTGPHLHYEVLVKGKQINPLSVKVPSGIKLAGKQLQRFTAAMTDIDKTFAALPERAKLASNATGGKPE